MEPFSVSALLAFLSHVLNLTILDNGESLLHFLGKSVVGGLIQGRAEDLYGIVKQPLIDRLKGLGPPDRHGLMGAARKSYLRATLILCQARLQEIAEADTRQRKQLHAEREILEQSQTYFRNELAEMKKPAHSLPATLIDSDAECLLRWQTDAASAAQLRERLTGEMLTEMVSVAARAQGATLGLRPVELPPRVVEMAHAGWRDAESGGANNRLHWFDLVCLFFAEEIKHDQRVANIFQSQLLIEIKHEGETQRLEFKSQVERLGEELLTRLGQQEPRLVEIIQAALKEIRRRPLYERLVSDEVAFRANQIKSRFTTLFVGRADELGQLDALIEQNPSGLMTITAPAGYGKSALLANWIDQQDGKGRFIAYHFFSERDDVARALTNCLYNLLRQLYIYYAERHEALPDDENNLKLAIANLIRQRGASKAEPLVIVLDGLDEADKEFSPLFSLPLPDGVFVIVSWRAGQDANSVYLQDWKQRAKPLDIERLPRAALKDWLRQANDGELAALADDEDLVAQLDDKSQGLPLYLSYLIDDLGQAVRRGADAHEALNLIPTGLGQYVARQVRLLDMPDKREVELLFALLAVSLGAVSKNELQALTGLGVHGFNRLPRRVTRWFTIVEQQSITTYSFAHPLLANEFEKALGADAQAARRQLLDYCARWPANRSQYGLRYYAAHLREEKRWEDLFALARDESYWQAQTEAFPESPDLPLKTVQTALLGAADKDDAGAMAEFLLAHARRLIKIATESPLEALRRGFLERAWVLADQHDADYCAVYYLLLAWELKDQERLAEARATLERLNKKELPRLSRGLGHQAAHLLLQTRTCNEEVFPRLRKTLLDDEGSLTLAGELASARQFQEALDTANQIGDAWRKAITLNRIAGEMAEAGMLDRAHPVFSEALATARRITHIANWTNAASQAHALADIAAEMARARQFDAALEIAWQLDETRDRGRALIAIAAEMVRAERLDDAGAIFAEALALAQLQEYSRDRAEALLAIAAEMAGVRLFDNALAIARLIDEKAGCAQALSVVAAKMAEAAALDQSGTVFSEALATARLIADVEPKAETLIAIAAEMFKGRQLDHADTAFDEALAAIQQINYGGNQINALMALVAAMAKARQFDKALATAQKLDNLWSNSQALSVLMAGAYKAQALSAIVTEMAKAKRFDDALATAELIVYTHPRASGLSAIAAELAKAGRFDEALAVIRRIDPGQGKIDALLAVAARLSNAHMFVHHRTALDQSLAIARRVDDLHDAWGRAHALSVIATKMATTGHLDEALVTARQIDDAESRLRASTAVAVEMARAKRFDVAMAMAHLIDDAWHKTNALTLIAAELTKAEQVDRAIEVARLIDEAWGKAQALALIAAEMVKIGRFDRAGAAFDEALEAARLMADAGGKASALIIIATEMTKVEMRDRAAAVFEDVLTTAQEIEHAGPKTDVLIAVASEMTEAGLLDRAGAAFDEALTALQMIDDAGRKAAALTVITAAMVRAAPLDQALAVAERIERHWMILTKDDWVKATVLAAVAAKLAGAGRFDQALATSRLLDDVKQKSKLLTAIATAMAGARQFDAALETARQIEMIEHKVNALAAIATEMVKVEMRDRAAAVFDEARTAARLVDYAGGKAAALLVIASKQAEADFTDRAVLTSQEILTDRSTHLPEIAAALAKSDPQGFKRLLVPCAYYLDGAYRICQLLAQQYPEQATAVAAVVQTNPAP